MGVALKEIGEELDKISNFITTWIDDNPYDDNLEEHNKKFGKDFKAFFDEENFVHEKYEFWSETY